MSIRRGRITPTLTLPGLRGRGSRRSGDSLPRKRGRVGVGARHDPVLDIVLHRCGIALGRVAPAAATAGFEDEAVARADYEAGFLGPDRARLVIAGVERVAVR